MRTPDVKLLGSDLAPRAILSDAVSLRYSKRFCGAGELRLVLPADAQAIPAPDEYVLCGGELFVVDRVERSTLTGETVVCGRGALSMLSRRIVQVPYVHRISVEGAACALVRAYASTLFSAPLTIETPQGGDASQLVVEAGDLCERVVTLVSSVNKGVSLTYDASGFTFAVTRGKDRRLSNSDENDAILLSESFGTIGGASETVDRSRYANKIYVRGSMTSDGNILLASVNAADYSFPDGFDDSSEPLREGYVKSGIGVTMFTTTDRYGNRVFDQNGYFDALYERGRRELADRRIAVSIEASLAGSAEDAVDTGDICTLSTPVSSATSVLVTQKEYRYENGKALCTAKLSAIA